jgi:transposase
MICVGIDVAKQTSTVCIMKPCGEVLRTPFSLPHTTPAVQSLVSMINSYDDEVRVVLEDTGHYHWPLLYTLMDQGVFVCSVNALRMKRFCAQSLRKAKTDRIDAARIAAYGLAYWHELTPALLPDDTYRQLRLLSRQYYQTVSLLTKAKVNLNNLLDQVMPGVASLMRDRKLLAFVQRYRHYDHIRKLGEKNFTADYCAWAKSKGYRQYERLAQKLFAMAHDGIPVLPNSPYTTIVVTEAVRLLQEIEASRTLILSQMDELAKSLPEYSVVRSMAGVGDTLAPLLIAEIGDVRRFHSKRALVAYAGIDAPPYQSGNFTGKERHISKRGNKYLRRSGYLIMLALLGRKPDGDSVYEFMRRKRDQGKCAKLAMMAGFNKFLRVYYGQIKELYHQIEVCSTKESLI